MVSISRPLLAFAAARAQGRVPPFGTVRQCAKFSNNVGDEKSRHQFKVLDRDLAYSGWRKIVKKTVRVEDEKDYVFDVIHQEEPSVAVFVWHTETQTLTLIKEFAPGREEVAHGVVAGMYEKDKHDSPLQAAKHELEEEAHLVGGTWHPLCDDDQTTINADKYSSNEFYCWLVVDPCITVTPKAMDDEEFIEIRRGITMPRAMSMLGGEIALRGEAIRCQKVADKINRSKEAPMLEGTDFVGGSVESPEFMLDGTASLFDGGQPHASTCLG